MKDMAQIQNIWESKSILGMAIVVILKVLSITVNYEVVGL